MKLERKFAAAEVKAADDETGTIEGYGSVFGVRDSYGDVVMKGAFAASLASGRKVRMLWQHRADQPIGSWSEMKEDDVGLFLRGRINLQTTWGRDAYASIKGGDIEGLSIGFVSKLREWSDDGETRLLREVELWEVSPVTFPANEAANLTGHKAFGDLGEIDGLDVVGLERSLRSLGMSREEAKRFLHRHSVVLGKAAADLQTRSSLQDLVAKLRA